MMTESRLAIFGTRGLAHHAGGDPSGRHARPRPVAAAITVLCLAVAGCAAVRTSTSGERQAVIDRIVAASAKVVIEQGGRRVASGSGVVVASRTEEPGIGAVSYVLTAAHILDGKEGADVFVRFTGTYAVRGKYAATVSRRRNAETLDLALLRVPGIAVPPVSFPADDHVRLGEEILVVGFPWGKRLGLFSGIVSQVPSESKEDVTAEEGTEQTIVVDAAAAKGVSGGGVFRESTGNLLGVVEGYQTASIAVKDRSQTYSVKVPMPGETFVVPITRIRRFLEDAGLDRPFGSPGRTEDRKD
jgi:S1-C subfamily serine protease